MGANAGKTSSDEDTAGYSTQESSSYESTVSVSLSSPAFGDESYKTKQSGEDQLGNPFGRPKPISCGKIESIQEISNQRPLNHFNGGSGKGSFKKDNEEDKHAYGDNIGDFNRKDRNSKLNNQKGERIDHAMPNANINNTTLINERVESPDKLIKLNKRQPQSGKTVQTQEENNVLSSTTVMNVNGLWANTNTSDKLSTKGKGANITPPRCKDLTRTAPQTESYDSDNELIDDITMTTDSVAEDFKEYPESYADKSRKRQYKREESELLREKTIVRDPDEWAYSYENKHSAIFKQEEPFKTQIFPRADIQKTAGQNFIVNTTQDSQRPPSAALPEYDLSEEMLLKDIEKDFFS